MHVRSPRRRTPDLTYKRILHGGRGMARLRRRAHRSATQPIAQVVCNHVHMRRHAAEMVAAELYDFRLRAYSLQIMAAVLGRIVHDRNLDRFGEVRGERPEIMPSPLHR